MWSDADLGAAKRVGRPTRAGAERLGTEILEAATALFLHDGYAATTMEAVAAIAGVSKRTLYKRYPDKPALLREAVAHLAARYLPGFEAAITETRATDGGLASVLRAAGRQMLAVGTAPETIALYRLIVAESARFPEIMPALNAAGLRAGIDRIASLLADRLPPEEALWAAEQFQRLVIAGPQARALGWAAPLTAAERGAWVDRAVALFLGGLDAVASSR